MTMIPIKIDRKPFIWYHFYKKPTRFIFLELKFKHQIDEIPNWTERSMAWLKFSLLFLSGNSIQSPFQKCVINLFIFSVGWATFLLTGEAWYPHCMCCSLIMIRFLCYLWIELGLFAIDSVNSIWMQTDFSENMSLCKLFTKSEYPFI